MSAMVFFKVYIFSMHVWLILLRGQHAEILFKTLLFIFSKNPFILFISIKSLVHRNFISTRTTLKKLKDI